MTKRTNERVAGTRLSKFSTFDNLANNELTKHLKHLTDARAKQDWPRTIEAARMLVNIAKNMETKNLIDIEAANVPFGMVQPDQVVVASSGKGTSRWMKTKQAVKASADVWVPIAAILPDLNTIMVGQDDPINSTQLEVIVGKSKFKIENKDCSMQVAYPRTQK